MGLESLNELTESSETLAGSEVQEFRFSDNPELEALACKVCAKASEEALTRISGVCKKLVEYYFRINQLILSTVKDNPWLVNKTDELAEAIDKVLEKQPTLRLDEAIKKAVNNIKEGSSGLAK